VDDAVAERRCADLLGLGIVDPEVPIGAGAVAAVEKLGLKFEEVPLRVFLERCNLLAVALTATGPRSTRWRFAKTETRWNRLRYHFIFNQQAEDRDNYPGRGACGTTTHRKPMKLLVLVGMLLGRKAGRA
jgi:hypothetical protein